MVILHEDNGCYGLSENTLTLNKKLLDFYHLKFEKILKSNDIPYKLSYYDDYEYHLEGDYFVGRFAQEWGDRTPHSKYKMPF